MLSEIYRPKKQGIKAYRYPKEKLKITKVITN